MFIMCGSVFNDNGLCISFPLLDWYFHTLSVYTLAVSLEEVGGDNLFMYFSLIVPCFTTWG